MKYVILLTLYSFSLASLVKMEYNAGDKEI